MSWELLFAITMAGAFAQAGTGLGVGVVAGPFLLQAYGYQQGMIETATLCLVTSLICAARTLRDVNMGAAMALCATLGPGVLAAFALTEVVAPNFLFIAFGLLLALFGASLARRGIWPSEEETVAPARSYRAVAAAGALAGAGAFLFAAPGPMAAWGLARAALEPATIRATLSVYFVVVYIAVLSLLVMVAGAPERALIGRIIVNIPACGVGALLGLCAGSALDKRLVRIGLAALVLASGLSILATRVS